MSFANCHLPASTFSQSVSMVLNSLPVGLFPNQHFNSHCPFLIHLLSVWRSTCSFNDSLYFSLALSAVFSALARFCSHILSLLFIQLLLLSPAVHSSFCGI